MGSPEEKTDRIETLQVLLDRLCAPDLTLGEAEGLRNRLVHLLEQNERVRGMERSA